MDNNRHIDAAERIKSSLGAADTAIILGSGLGGLSARLENAASLSYSEIPGFPVSTAPGHAGRIYCGFIGTKAVYCLSGRFHYYEGYSPDQVVFAVRALHCAGVKTLIVTNAAGGINLSYHVGDFVVITDHLSFFAESPLRGQNEEAFGLRFPSMDNAYDSGLVKLAEECGTAMGLNMHRGVYAYMKGPQFETHAEIRALRLLGADLAGMSTVYETITARHCGMRVLGISCVTNMAAGISDKPVSHQDVSDTEERIKADFTPYINRLIEIIK